MNLLASPAAFAFTTACVLLFVGPAQATGPGPVTPHHARPTPVAQKTLAARSVVARPTPARPAAPSPPALKPEATPRLVDLSGTIRGANGQPCPGACVFPTTNPRLLAVTDATGFFRLQVPASAGPVRLQADYFGLGSSRVEVDGQHPQPVSIVLGR